ncbi:MAG TPA: hypothetical protein PLI71_09735 [Clostridia bacterium]|nr:hypothetical protein [Clostridia bacterium]
MKLTTFMIIKDSEEIIAVAISPHTVKNHIEQILKEYTGEKTASDFIEYLTETQGCEVQVLTNNVIEI